MELKKQIAILASGNKHKLEEIQVMLKDFEFEIKSLKDVHLEHLEIEENGSTFEENALIKAKAVQEITGGIVLADDSGLEVDALNGAPGVFSARYAGVHGNDQANNQKLLEKLSGVEYENRSARFVSAIAMVFEGEEPAIIVRGTVEGLIQFEPKGANGFGYDPLFYYPPFEKTMAEMTMTEKNTVSHRSNALSILRLELEKKYEGMRR